MSSFLFGQTLDKVSMTINIISYEFAQRFSSTRWWSCAHTIGINLSLALRELMNFQRNSVIFLMGLNVCNPPIRKANLRIIVLVILVMNTIYLLVNLVEKIVMKHGHEYDAWIVSLVSIINGAVFVYTAQLISIYVSRYQGIDSSIKRVVSSMCLSLVANLLLFEHR